MLSIIGLDDAKLKDICEKARAKATGSDTVCQLANYLFPSGRVVSGHKDALAEVQALATAAGAIKCAPLAVSGAFHTPLMQPARDNLVKVALPSKKRGFRVYLASPTSSSKSLSPGGGGRAGARPRLVSLGVGRL